MHISACIVKATYNLSKPCICMSCLQTLWLKWAHKLMWHWYSLSIRKCISYHIDLFSSLPLLSANITFFSSWCIKLSVNNLTNTNCWSFHWIVIWRRSPFFLICTHRYHMDHCGGFVWVSAAAVSLWGAACFYP